MLFCWKGECPGNKQMQLWSYDAMTGILNFKKGEVQSNEKEHVYPAFYDAVAHSSLDRVRRIEWKRE